MCGRYTLHQKVDNIAKRFNLDSVPSDIHENFNVAPGQIMPVITEDETGRHLELMKWGFIPVWAKDPKMGYKLINARDDGIFEKPMWRSVIQKKRALIPADGFYEWKSEGTGKTPWLFRLDSGVPFAFAGLWERREAPGAEPLETFAIVTTSANDLVREVHARMPVILDAESEALWRRPGPLSAAELERCLAPFDAAAMEAWPVSTWVNTPAHDGPRCVEPAR